MELYYAIKQMQYEDINEYILMIFKIFNISFLNTYMALIFSYLYYTKDINIFCININFKKNKNNINN